MTLHVVLTTVTVTTVDGPGLRHGVCVTDSLITK